MDLTWPLLVVMACLLLTIGVTYTLHRRLAALETWAAGQAAMEDSVWAALSGPEIMEGTDDGRPDQAV